MQAGLQPLPESDVEGWRSPRLDMRFWVHPENGLTVELPDGRAVLSYAEVNARRIEAEAARAEAEAARAEAEAARNRLAARLRELGVDPGSL